MRRKQMEFEAWLTFIGFAIGIALFVVPIGSFGPIGGVTYFICWYTYRRNRLKRERGEPWLPNAERGEPNPSLEPWQIRQLRQDRPTKRSWKLF